MKNKQGITYYIFYLICFLLLLQINVCKASEQNQQATQKPIRILVIEGGGIYGVLSATILQEFEKKSHQPISKLFDVMVGTSTGSIQIALLNTPRPGTRQPLYTAADVVDFYLTFAGVALHIPWQRKLWTLHGFLAPLLTQDGLEYYAQKTLGNTELKDSLTTILIPSYDINTASLFVFNNRDAQQQNYRLADIVLASTAIPNIMPAKPWLFADGTHYLTDATIVVNNPSILALLHTALLYPNQNKIIVSLGSGKRAAPDNPEVIGKKGFSGALENWFNIFSQGTDDSFSDILQAEADNHRLNLINYFRLNPLLPKDVGDAINASSQNMTLLKNTADTYVKNHQQKLAEIVATLKQSQD